MRKMIITCAISLMLILPGCSTTAGGSLFNREAKVETKEVWWGTKEEIKTFLDSPQAKARRWFIQALGGEE